jgi:hypothetical protein
MSPEHFNPRAWWELLKDDHRRDPDALPWVLEATGCMYCATIVAAVAVFGTAWAYSLIGVGVLALCMVLRFAVKRWEP